MGKIDPHSAPTAPPLPDPYPRLEERVARSRRLDPNLLAEGMENPQYDQEYKRSGQWDTPVHSAWRSIDIVVQPE